MRTVKALTSLRAVVHALERVGHKLDRFEELSQKLPPAALETYIDTSVRDRAHNLMVDLDKAVVELHEELLRQQQKA